MVRNLYWKHWLAFAIVVSSFATLGYYGREIYRKAPPYPSKVVAGTDRISVLPVGLMQTVASVEHGMWYARSAEFLQGDGMDTLRWLRVIGDTIFAVGILALGWFIAGLHFGWSTLDQRDDAITEDQHAVPPQ